MADPSAAKPDPGRPRSRWKRRLACLAVAACLAAFFRGAILRSVAEFLVVDEPRSVAQAVLIVGGESQFDTAAQLHESGAKVVFLRRSNPGRLERMGILRSTEETTRRELLARGVPESDFSPLSDEPVESGRVGASLSDWLREHPNCQIDVLCDRFLTRTWHLLLRRSADPALVSRIHLVALPHRSFDESNWWHSKPGQRAILNGYLRLGFTWWYDGPPLAGRECTSADFESVVVRKAVP